MLKDRRSTRMTLAGLFATGVFYSVLVLAEGRWFDPSVHSAIIIEAALVYLSLMRRTVTKRDVGVAFVIVLVYVYASLALAIFSEMTVMAAAGITIFILALIEPKFPLTKRAIATGIVVGIVMTFLGIYLALKLGVVYFVGAEMLGALILGAHGKYTPQENTIVVAIANGSSMISMGVLITFPAIEIFAPEVAPALITYPFIVFVTGASAVFGLILLAPFRDRFENEPWPQVKPQAECIISLGMDRSAKLDVATGLCAAGAWVGASKVAETVTGESLATFPRLLKPVWPIAESIPDWIGLSNSPLVAAIGYFVGWKRTLVLTLGSVISLMVWIVLEGAQPIPYGAHLHRPEILYLVLGVFATIISGDIALSRKTEELTPEEFEELVTKTHETSDESELSLTIDRPHKVSDIAKLIETRQQLFSMDSLREEIRQLVQDPRAYLRSRGGQVPAWVALVSITFYTIISIAIFSIIRPFAGLEIHWLLFVIGAPLALVSAYFTAKAISETGMLAGYISDIMSIPAILIFRATFQAISTFISMLGALQDSAIALLVHLKLGRLTGVKGRDIFKAVFLGALLGTFVGSLMIYMVYATYHFGTTEFPAPAAQLFGFLVISLQDIGNLILPGMSTPLFPGVPAPLQFLYLLSFGVTGFLLGRTLDRRGLSPMSLVVGLLIPPATSAAMLIGGLIDYRVKRNAPADPFPERIEVQEMRTDRPSRILSGIVAGEAIVTVIWVLWSALMFFLPPL